MLRGRRFIDAKTFSLFLLLHDKVCPKMRYIASALEIFQSFLITSIGSRSLLGRGTGLSLRSFSLFLLLRYMG